MFGEAIMDGYESFVSENKYDRGRDLGHGWVMGAVMPERSIELYQQWIGAEDITRRLSWTEKSEEIRQIDFVKKCETYWKQKNQPSLDATSLDATSLDATSLDATSLDLR